MAITLADLQKMSKEDMAKLIVDLASKNDRKVTFKVTAAKPDGTGTNGAVSVYGIHSRFPVTLYASQWEKLFGVKDALTAFIAANAATIARKV